MRRLLRIAFVLALVPGFASARQVSRDDYYVQLPAMPKLVGQTDASHRIHLYGDAASPGYLDRDPVDGVDDTRAARLLRIADLFSPILRRNNFSVPRLHTSVLGAAPMLHVDTWRRGQRVASDSVPIHRPMTTNTSVGGEVDPSIDSVLAALVREFHPDAAVARFRQAEWDDEKVLFFDFPGDRPATWRDAYRDARDSSIYAHFFIHEDTAATGAARYLLVIQFWFFYPFNDGTNNHEGDWEHLDVAVTTLGRAAGSASGFLAEDDIARIIDPANDAVLDSTIIRSVDYFFHESVMRLDYLGARNAPPIDNWRELRHLHIWEQPDFIVGTIRSPLRLRITRRGTRRAHRSRADRARRPRLPAYLEPARRRERFPPVRSEGITRVARSDDAVGQPQDWLGHPQHSHCARRLRPRLGRRAHTSRALGECRSRSAWGATLQDVRAARTYSSFHIVRRRRLPSVAW
ncbi:MAG: hypothetical protein ACREMQ_23640 [Longimicrobiales bacterium]